MAPHQENQNMGNQARNQRRNLRNEQAVQQHLQLYIDHGYTEEMYREHAGDVYEVLENLYPIEDPEVLFGRLNSYREVIVEYARIVPLFELEAFGM